MPTISITLGRKVKSLQVTICTEQKVSFKIFFIVKTESIEVDNANVTSEHVPLIPEFARFLCTSKCPLALVRFHGPFQICWLIICIYCLETKAHLLLKQTNKTCCAFLSHLLQGDLYISDILTI